MTLSDCKDLLLACLAINYGILIIWFLAILLVRDKLYRLHARWFFLSHADFDRIHYAGLALYKILVLVFNLAPWLALQMLA